MHKKPIHRIKRLFDTNEITEEMIEQLRVDQRKGIQQLLAIYDQQKVREEKRLHEFLKKQQFDKQFRKQKSDLIAGVDEAGRGPLAGPVVAAAVILPKDFIHLGLNDSKQLTETKRDSLFDIIKDQAISYSIALVHAEQIDKLNIFEATKQVMKNALTTLDITPQIALIDAMQVNGITYPQKAIIKGDEKSVAIAAASILAKVSRDRFMLGLDMKYPMYDFKNNKGYGTKQHLLALQKYGPTIYHRKSFAPVQNVMNG